MAETPPFLREPLWLHPGILVRFEDARDRWCWIGEAQAKVRGTNSMKVPTAARPGPYGRRAIGLFA